MSRGEVCEEAMIVPTAGKRPLARVADSALDVLISVQRAWKPTLRYGLTLCVRHRLGCQSTRRPVYLGRTTSLLYAERHPGVSTELWLAIRSSRRRRAERGRKIGTVSIFQLKHGSNTNLGGLTKYHGRSNGLLGSGDIGKNGAIPEPRSTM